MGKVEELTKLIETSHPEWKNLSIRELRDTSGYKKWVCEAYFKNNPKDNNKTVSETKKKGSDSGKKKIKDYSSDIPDTTQPLTKEELINKLSNPIEFVQSIIVEELMNTRDVRWAQLFTTILDKTKKLDYDTIKEKEWLNQAKNMELSDIVELVAKRESISRTTLRRLDELEDTSPYENL